MSRLFKIAIVCLLLIGANGCKKPAPASNTDKPANVKTEPQAQEQEEESSAVMFDIKIPDAPGTSGVRRYDCTYKGGGKTAKFILQFKQVGAISGGLSLASSEGKFLAVAGSDNSILLADLKLVLEATRVPKKSSRIAELPFDAVIVGEKLSRSGAGGYASDPPGDWTAIKIFLPQGANNPDEVFLGLNPVLGKAEFSMKDPDYGDHLLAQLAKVL